MTARRSVVVAIHLLLITALGMGGSAYAERFVCDQLVLPYFEVELVDPAQPDWSQHATTTFSVGNCGKHTLTARIQVWTNWGLEISELTTDIRLGPKDLFTANLRDWLVFGRLPDRELTSEELTHVHAALCGDPSPRDGLYYSDRVDSWPPETVEPMLATGYLTIRAVDLFAHHEDLWGDFFVLRPDREFARGESLVRIVGDPSREVCQRHVIRFLEGGLFAAGTRFVFWTGVGGNAPSADPLKPPFELQSAQCKVYDEDGLLIAEESIPLKATQAVEVGKLGWIEPFGWVECSTPVDSFVCAEHSAEDRYSVTLRAFCEPEQAGPPPQPRPSIHIEKLTNGEDADVPPGPVMPAGSPVDWTYIVTNPGPVDLLQVHVSDDQGVEVHCPGDTLGIGESMTCIASGVVPAGQYRNLGLVAARTPEGVPVGDSDPSHCFGIEEELPAAIDIEKHTNGFDADLPPGPTLPVGHPVVWTYGVTNAGQVPLTDVTVTDSEGVSVNCPRTTLGVGESMACTGLGVAVLGQYENLGTAVGTAPDGTVVSDTDPSHYLCEEEPPVDGEGCTPGYWKNHTESWTPTGYAPAQTVESVFGQAAAYGPIGDATLLEALDFGGGPGVEGAARILLRAGVASLLNATHPDVGFVMTEAEVIAWVDGALASGDRDDMLTVAALMDANNNLGCPL